MSEKSGQIQLSSLISGIYQSLVRAKENCDRESIRLTERNRKEKYHPNLTVPAFSIKDVEIALKFAIVECKGKDDQWSTIVNYSSEYLKELSDQEISVMKLSLEPQDIRVFEEDDQSKKS